MTLHWLRRMVQLHLMTLLTILRAVAFFHIDTELLCRYILALRKYNNLDLFATWPEYYSKNRLIHTMTPDTVQGSLKAGTVTSNT